MNYLANFNQTWWETCLKDGDSDCSNKGDGPFWGPIRGKIRKMLIKIFFSWNSGRNALMFGMEHPWGKVILISPGRRPWELMPWRSVRRPSVRFQLFPLNDFFSRTTRPISTKFGRKHVWGWGFRFVQIKVWPLLAPNKGQNKENFDKSSITFLSWTNGRNALIFSMAHPWGKEIQFYSNKVPRVMCGPTPGA